MGKGSVQGNKKALIDYSFSSNSFDIPQMENSPGKVIYWNSLAMLSKIIFSWKIG